MKLNLPNYECVDFEIRSDFAVSTAIENTLRSVIEQTSHHGHGVISSGVRDGTVGVFGSRFVAKGVSHRAIGNLLVGQKDGEYWVDVWLVNRVEDSVSRPPRTIKPVSLLLDVVAEVCRPAMAVNNANFEYDEAAGWISKVVLPTALLLPWDAPGLTHIESVELSHRDQDGVRYRVNVDRDVERNKIIHSVNFRSEIEWTNGSFRKSLNYARTLSAQLLTKKEE